MEEIEKPTNLRKIRTLRAQPRYHNFQDRTTVLFVSESLRAPETTIFLLLFFVLSALVECIAIDGWH